MSGGALQVFPAFARRRNPKALTQMGWLRTAWKATNQNDCLLLLGDWLAKGGDIR